MRILNSLIVPKILKKRDPLGFFNIRSVANYQKLKRGLFGDIKKISKKSLTKPKSLIAPKNVRTFCFRILLKILAHTHGFEHETSGLKSKHLTTRPRTRETCDLPREMRELSRGKKHPHFPITLVYRKCNKRAQLLQSLVFFLFIRQTRSDQIFVVCYTKRIRNGNTSELSQRVAPFSFYYFLNVTYKTG